MKPQEKHIALELHLRINADVNKSTHSNTSVSLVVLLVRFYRNYGNNGNNLTGDVCSFATLMVYKIPMEDIKSLAKSFSELEKGELNISEPVWL